MFGKIFLIFTLVTSAHTWAHGSHEPGDEHALEATLSHYAKIVDLAPEVLADKSLSTPIIRISGVDVPMNGPFWQLVQGWIRLYYQELQKECDHCITFSEDQFTEAARDHAAKSFVSLKVKEPVLEGIEHLAVGTADIGSQLGATAAVAKAAAEVAETGASKFIGGGGVHLFCHVLDAIILFGTRHVQTSARIFSWAGAFDNWGSAALIKMGFVSGVVRRAQKRVQFELQPVEIDTHEMSEVDEEGPNRWWGYVQPGKRSAWLNKLVRKSESDKIVTLNQREFLGQRMKRYLWLKGRKRGHADFMKGQTPMDKSLNRSVLWILSVQENMIQRAFLPKGNEIETARASLAQIHSAPQDEIRRGLSEEFATTIAPLSSGKADLLEGLLRDVEVIFNPQVPRKVRYFHSATIESVMAGFLYGRFNEVLNEAGEIHGASVSGIGRQVRLHWRAGRFGAYIYQWTDFLRLAALQNDRKILAAHKYEAMEALLRLFKIFHKSQALAKIETVEQLMKIENQLLEERNSLVTYTPWQKKSIARSWLAWRDPVPTCQEMERL